MSVRMQRPESVRLELAEVAKRAHAALLKLKPSKDEIERSERAVALAETRGDWLLVKKYLTAGEQRAIFRRMMRDGMTGDQIDSVRVGWSKMIGYLLDWSFQDADGKPVVISDKSEDEIGAALDALDVASFQEVLRAIEAHESRMEQELEVDKARPTTEIASSAISP